MSKAVRELRAALERFLLGEQAAALLRAREPAEDREPASREVARFLLSSAGRDALAEALERGELEPLERDQIAAHLAALPYSLQRLSAEQQLRARLRRLTTSIGAPLEPSEGWARIAFTLDARSRSTSTAELEIALEPVTLAHAETLLQAEQALHVAGELPQPAASRSATSSLILSAFDPDVLSPPSRDLPQRPWLADASQFLQATEAAADDAVAYLLRRLHGAGPRPLHTLLHALRAPELDSEVGRRSRSLRVSAWLRGLGFEADLQRMRGEVDQGAIGPEASVLLVDPPRDVRVAIPSKDFGVASDLSAAAGVARGLAHALCHPALPLAARVPAVASTAGAFAMLGMLAWADREGLARAQGLTDLQAERVSRLLGTCVLLQARALSALALVPAFEPKAARERLEAQAEALALALRVEVPPFGIGLFTQDRVGARERALEALAGLSVAHGLRERFDSDWHRNPRTAHALRNAAARGAGLAPEAFAADVSASLKLAAARANELVA